MAADFLSWCKVSVCELWGEQQNARYFKKNEKARMMNNLTAVTDILSICNYSLEGNEHAEAYN